MCIRGVKQSGRDGAATKAEASHHRGGADGTGEQSLAARSHPFIEERSGNVAGIS